MSYELVVQAYYNIFNRGDKEPSENYLGCSGDLCGCLRRLQLRVAGAPQAEPTLKEQAAENINAVLGRYWHDAMERELKALDVKNVELRLSDSLPDGWGGRLDVLLPLASGKYRVADFKFKDASALHRASVLPAYEYQLTAYYHALAESGLSVDDTLAVIFLNRGPYIHRRETTEPYVICEFQPIMDRDSMWDYMRERKSLVDAYATQVQQEGDYLTDLLAGPEGAVQRLTEVKQKGVKYSEWDLYLEPIYETKFCEFNDDLCACRFDSVRVGSYRFMDGEWSYTHALSEEVHVLPRIAPDGYPRELLAETCERLARSFYE